ncbi:MAG: outer membrane protein transport protein [Deltaproteobacteria bacterium]|nr:outer membrane protein transport protein [Deltaproteobacteria bacterium]
MILLAATAQAAGFYFMDSGVRAQGRAGAFVAGADDISAQYYNPAALSRQDRASVALDLWAISQSVDFDRADELGWNAFEAVQNTAPPQPEPAGGVVLPLGPLHPALAGTTLALGLYLPTSPLLAYPSDGPQRYALVSSSVLQGYAGPTLAHRLAPWLSLGAGLQYTFLSVTQSITAIQCVESIDTCGTDSPSDDIRMDLDTVDPARLSWNAGVLVEPTPWLAVGASVQPQIDYRTEGSMTVTFSEDNTLVRPELTAGSFTDDDVTVDATLPWIARLGVQVSPSERARVELAGTWTQWSAMSALRITDVDLSLTTREEGVLKGEPIVVTDDVPFATGFVDSWSARLGGEYDVVPAVRARAGVAYETSAVPSDYVSVFMVDGPKLALAAGATARIGKRVSLSASFMDQIIFPRTIEDSRYAQQAIFVDFDKQFATTVTSGKVVGNGDLSSNVIVAGLGVNVDIGRGDSQAR